MTTNDLYPTIAARIGDPGAYIPRKLTPSGEPMESVPRWAARAVVEAVQPVIDELTAQLNDALPQITAAWIALDRAGFQSPVDGIAALIDQLTDALTEARAQAATHANTVGALTSENARLRQQRDELIAERAKGNELPACTPDCPSAFSWGATGRVPEGHVIARNGSRVWLAHEKAEATR
ncbi:hypothetical protein [Micromonospora tarensis]|uniref:Uncharacterized protein n=1 Tax=Micromonospora tarensis TaxID=2806100 RepID=A0ABS1YIH4_9ACTN|nr:hypothetical protein [Micromonospora tarensis]MBM0277234.1 hypothetical protein [Micromonospora tarensis]